MNERIKQLAEQAGINCIVPTAGTLEYPSKGEVNHLKSFAELIIRECCFTGEQWANGLIDPKHYAFVNKMIRKRFGVEE